MVYARARSILLIDNSTIVASQQSVIGGSVTGLDKAFRRGFIKIGVGPVLLILLVVLPAPGQQLTARERVVLATPELTLYANHAMVSGDAAGDLGSGRRNC